MYDRTFARRIGMGKLATLAREPPSYRLEVISSVFLQDTLRRRMYNASLMPIRGSVEVIAAYLEFAGHTKVEPQLGYTVGAPAGSSTVM
jgi:hypothetical protein